MAQPLGAVARRLGPEPSYGWAVRHALKPLSFKVPYAVQTPPMASSLFFFFGVAVE